MSIRRPQDAVPARRRLVENPEVDRPWSVDILHRAEIWWIEDELQSLLWNLTIDRLDNEVDFSPVDFHNVNTPPHAACIAFFKPSSQVGESTIYPLSGEKANFRTVALAVNFDKCRPDFDSPRVEVLDVSRLDSGSLVVGDIAFRELTPDAASWTHLGTGRSFDRRPAMPRHRAMAVYLAWLHGAGLLTQRRLPSRSQSEDTRMRRLGAPHGVNDVIVLDVENEALRRAIGHKRYEWVYSPDPSGYEVLRLDYDTE